MKINVNAKYDSSTIVFDENTCPAKLKSAHCVQENHYGVLNILEGELKFTWENTKETIILKQHDIHFVDELKYHYLTIDKPVKFRIDFFIKK